MQERQSGAEGPIDRAELDKLIAALELEGQFYSMTSSVTTGRWKRRGTDPLVLVSVTVGATSTLLAMQRIDHLGGSKP